MATPPDPLRGLFDRTRVRLRLLALAGGIVLALVISLPVLIARLAGVLSTSWAVVVTAAILILAGAVAVWRAPRRPDALAAAIEKRTPTPRNLLVTAAQLVVRPAPIRADVRDVVMRDAADAAARVDLAALFPARRAMLRAAGAVVVWIALFFVQSSWVARARDVVRSSLPGAPAIVRVSVTVTPPAYTGRPSQSFDDPERIEALSGSRIHVRVVASAEHVDLLGLGDRRALQREGRGAFAGDATAIVDGFIAVQPFGAADATGVRRVIALAVTPDRSPVARLVSPGKDLFLPAATATVPVKIDATDDIGLSTLRLTYTKVTGSGENFQFAHGEFPLAITRGRPDAWSATSAIPLATLGLEAGDVLVYRAVVGDTLPGREPVESDAFVIEILRPGEALAEGFSIDEETDKYAISQQMVIVKTERLIAEKASLSAGAFAERAQTIAAEQRRVRAEFVFMMGGEFEDASSAAGDINEEEEAANEAELLAGRMQNNGRRDIITATRHMSDAAQWLTNINPAQALPREKAALDALQRAFTKSRYILRVLTPRERVEDARRLSGKLADASAWRRLVPDVPEDPQSLALMTALAGVGRVAGLTEYGPAEANELSAIAELILRADATLAPVAQAFARAGASIGESRSAGEIAALIDAAAARLSVAARRGLPGAPRSVNAAQARLRGAVADALKRGGGRR